MIKYLTTNLCTVDEKSLDRSIDLSQPKKKLSWQCVGIAVLLHAASWVRSSSGENFSGREDFSLGVIMGSDSIPLKLFRMRV